MKNYLILLIAVSVTAKSNAQSFSINSPDKKINIVVNTTGKLSYAVNYTGKALVMESPMGFEFKAEPAMGGGMIVIAKDERLINERWQPVVKSKHAVVINYANELHLSLKEAAGKQRRMDVYFRAYNDGVAFRYKLFGANEIGDRQIVRELTGFQMARNTKAWIAEYGGYSSSQEGVFWPRDLSYVNTKTIAALPFLMEADKDTYIAITEANINNYPGFYVGRDSSLNNRIALTTKLARLPGEREDGIKVRFADTLLSPWRVLMIADKPGKLIESEIIQNLNEPCALKDVSWIKPGISAWDHWWSGEVKMDMPTIKQYVDLAAAQGWPYMLIDWQWYGPFNKPEADITKPAPQLNMPELLQYAKSKHVKYWLWLYSSDVNRNSSYEKAFALYQQWGVVGIKIDFMDRDDQEMVNWYRRIIQSAARHHLMVDFHGAYKPDGIIRTYPNMITREGVMGEEYSKFSNNITPEHNTTLPFTRMLAGQMDYTPGGFLNVTKAKFKQQSPTLVMNTRCAELSKFVIYESPFTVYCDAPQNILGKPGADFLKLVPTVWDDIKVLEGYPGKWIAMAKRSGNKWFIGAMNNSQQKEITLKLDFLPPGKYQVEIWADGADADQEPQSVTRLKQIVKSVDSLKVKMAIGGGYVAYLVPVKP